MNDLSHLPGMKPFLTWTIFLVVVASLVAVFARVAPPQHNPFKPFSLDDPVGMATHHKLASLFDDREACFAALDAAEIRYTPLEDSEPGANCGFYDALTLDQSLFPYSATVRLTCPLAAGLSLWEEEIVQPAALGILGSEVVGIETYGSYACRRMYGRTSGRWSEHATANAIDIAGFRLADGRTITLLKDWGADSDEGAFLARVRNRSCRVFSVVLGPDYNAAHADHFHFDMGGGDVCS